MKLGKYTWIYLVITLGLIATAGIAYASFADKGEILGSSFSVGSADIKLLIDITGGVDDSNLTDQLNGPSFTNITPNWEEDYLVKLYNNASTALQLTTNADYLTANDPDDLRSIIYVEPIPWNDINNNGIVESGETSTSIGKKTIVKWKTEGFDLGSLTSGEVKGFILKFSTGTISETKQGKTALFDFEFNSVSLE